MVLLDTRSSLELATLLPTAKYLIDYYTRPAKLVWECCELNHLDPATIMDVAIVSVKSQIFDVMDVFSYQLNALSTRYFL